MVAPKPAPAPRPPAPPAPAAAPGDPAPAPAPSPGPEGEPEPAEERFEVAPPHGAFERVGFTNRGAAIRYVTLRDSFEGADRRHRMDVLLPVAPDLLTGAIEVVSEDGRTLVRTDRVWTRDLAEEARTKELDVVFRLEAGGGLRFRKRFVLPTEGERYDADVSLDAVATSAERAGRDVTVRLIATAGLVHEPTNEASFAERERLVHHVLGQSGDPQYQPYKIEPAVDLDEVARERRTFRLLGVQSQYFASVLWHEGGKDAPRVRRLWGGGIDPARQEAMRKGLIEFFREERGRSVAEEGEELGARIARAADHFHQAWTAFDLRVAKEGEAGETATFHLFVGPLDRDVLGEDRYDATLGPLITYPYAFDFLARFLLGIFDLFDGLIGSAGLAVILMTLVVRGGLMPLSVRNQLSMRRHGRKVSKLKPKLEALKKKWAHDRRRFQEEQVKLYREHGVGFPAGCIMLLFQIPIFMALFSSLRVEYDLRHRSFLWIEDLSGPDNLIDFGTSLSLLGIPPGGINGLNLIPLLSVALSFWQYRLMPKPTDEQQAQQMKMMKWMPVIFAVLLYNYTAALSLYMVFSSLVAIVESAWVRAKDRHEVEAAAA